MRRDLDASRGERTRERADLLRAEHTTTFETILTDTVRVTAVSWDDAYDVLAQVRA